MEGKRRNDGPKRLSPADEQYLKVSPSEIGKDPEKAWHRT